VTAETLESIRATAAVVEAMANGTAAKKLYIASGPTGSGKTTAMRCAIETLIADLAYRHVGILVLTNTLEQIETLVREMKLERRQFDVRTGLDNFDLNEMGLTGMMGTKKAKAECHHHAQVLFMTQAKVRAIAEHQPSYTASSFYQYRPLFAPTSN